jgi:uncharacterized protein YdbL (DUF1318 family)
MMRAGYLPFLCSLFVLFGLIAPVSGGAAPAAARQLIESMESRLPALMDLKLAGSVGENNQGLVEARGNLDRDQRRLIADENRDRLAHYQLIAERLQVSVAKVQSKRAEQIRLNSPRGVWIESKSGEWYRE